MEEVWVSFSNWMKPMIKEEKRLNEGGEFPEGSLSFGTNRQYLGEYWRYSQEKSGAT